jgi:hypothetical protein
VHLGWIIVIYVYAIHFQNTLLYTEQEEDKSVCVKQENLWKNAHFYNRRGKINRY